MNVSPPTPVLEVAQLDQSLAELDKKLSLPEDLESQLKALDQKMEADAKAQLEKQQSQERKPWSKGRDQGIER